MLLKFVHPTSDRKTGFRPHDLFKRHGSTTLFAALNVLSGAVLASCKPRHRHKAVPIELDVHCIVGNYARRGSPVGLAAHFIPTYSSWLNHVERFFAMVTHKAIHRGSFSSVKQLVKRIDHFVASHNQNAKPFRWTATADPILESCIDFAHASLGQDISWSSNQ